MPANAQHSAATPEHYAPPEFIEAARATMGAIDLDPATAPRVNAAHVRAPHLFTRKDDGLTRARFGRVWLNPPGGRVGNRSSAAFWWSKLADEWSAGRVEQAVFLGFSIELLTTSQGSRVWPCSLPFRIPRRSIEFLRESAEEAFVPGECPTHANVIVFLPPADEAEAAFDASFSKFGMVRM